MIERFEYLEKLKKWKDKDVIKVVTLGSQKKMKIQKLFLI